MGKEVVEYDPTAVLNKVRDTIKAKFAELVPEEEWEKMINNAVNEFTSGELVNIVKEMARDHLKEIVKDRLAQLGMDNSWNHTIDDKLKEIIKENAGDLMAGMIGNAMKQVIANMRSGVY